MHQQVHPHWSFLVLRAINTGKLCHHGKCHSGNCHSGERWMSRPFVHSGNLNFKHTFTNDLVFHNAWKRIICHFYNIKKDMLLTGPFAMLSVPSFDFHLPPCTEGFLIHLSPLWQLPLWQLPLFPLVAQFPCESYDQTWDLTSRECSWYWKILSSMKRWHWKSHWKWYSHHNHTENLIQRNRALARTCNAYHFNG